MRLFNPTGAGTWLLSELDIGIRDIAECRGLMGLGIERDLWFDARGIALSTYAEAAGPQAASSSPDPSSTTTPSDPGPGPPPAPDGISRTAIRPVPVTPGAGRFPFRPDLGDLE